jgi:hypothetical protein
MLGDARWYLVTDISGQRVGPIFVCHAVHVECWDLMIFRTFHVMAGGFWFRSRSSIRGSECVCCFTFRGNVESFDARVGISIKFCVRELKLKVVELVNLMKLKLNHINFLTKADRAKISMTYHVKCSFCNTCLTAFELHLSMIYVCRSR